MVSAKLIPAGLKRAGSRSRGVIETSITGIGTAAVLQTGDNFIGSPLQSFGIVIPFIGIRISIIDLIVYAVHAGGIPGKKKGMIKGLTAVAASKFIQGSLSLSGLTALGAQSGNASTTATQGPTGGGI